MKLGRSAGRRTAQTSSSSALAARAEKRLDNIVESYAARVESALMVDGVQMLIWNRQRGRYRCACEAGSGKAFAAEDTSISQSAPESEADDTVVSTTTLTGKPTRSETSNTSGGRFFPVDNELSTGGSSTARQRILKEDDGRLNPVYNEAEQRRNDTRQDDITDDSLSGALNALDEADDLMAGNIVNCPICFGSGFTDAWQPDKGIRLPLDLSGRFPTKSTAETLDSGDVPKFQLTGNQSITWTFRLPAAWQQLLRASLFNDDSIVAPSKYVATLKLYGSSSAVPLTNQLLRSLRNDPDVAAGPVELRLQAKPGTALQATHFDFVYMTGELTRGQMPEVEVPYEDEFPDWNLNVSIELSPKANVKEGSYIVDNKYKRVWKVDSYSRKQTASGKAFGTTATMRVLHPFEKVFTLMNVFRR